jgi:hypothetical protein
MDAGCTTRGSLKQAAISLTCETVLDHHPKFLCSYPSTAGGGGGGGGGGHSRRPLTQGTFAWPAIAFFDPSFLFLLRNSISFLRLIDRILISRQIRESLLHRYNRFAIQPMGRSPPAESAELWTTNLSVFRKRRRRNHESTSARLRSDKF